MAGGIHGRNRLGGNSLLDCVVFGRVAGDTACRHLLTSAIKALRTGGPASNSSETALNRVASINAHLNPERAAAGAQQWAGAGAALASPAASYGGGGQVAPSPPVAAKASGGARSFTEAEIAKHNSEGDLWVVIEGKVYDLTSFLPDHPGGKKAIMLFAGKDATEEFNMLHPPNVLKKYLSPDALLGVVA